MNERHEVALTRWLSRHHGVITAQQAGRLEISPKMLYGLTKSGRLVRRHQGVYVDAASSVTPTGAWTAQAAAALAALGPDAALSHRSAAWLTDLLPRLPRPIEVLVPSNSSRSRLNGVHLRRTHVPFPFRARLGLRVTDPGRTVLDIAATTPAVVDGVIDRAMSLRVLRAEDLESLTDRAQETRGQSAATRRRRGAAALRTHLDRLGYLRPPAPSVLESAMARIFVAHHLPRPIAEYTAGAADEYRLDFAYPEVKLAIEVDGYRWHSDPRRMDADYARRRRLEAQGWVVMPFTWREVMADPDGVAAQIAARHLQLAAQR